jgi:Flp pilus assembly protein TadG
VLLTPVLMFAVFLIVQFALWYYARGIVLAAAQEGARAARAEQGSAAAGQARAYAYLDRLGGDLVTDPAAEVTRGPDTVVARVTGRAVNIVPGLTMTITERSIGPVERFRPAP